MDKFFNVFRHATTKTILAMPCDYSKYPANWKTEIRPQTLARAGNCCEFCGVPNGAIIWRNGPGRDEWKFWPHGMESEAWSVDGRKSTLIVLTISHLDHDTANNAEHNLRALCQKCHLNHDKGHHAVNARETIRKKRGLQNLF